MFSKLVRDELLSSLSEVGILPKQNVMVDNDNFPFRCKVCHSWKHRVKGCKECYWTPTKGFRKLSFTFQATQHEKCKGITIIEEGSTKKR